MDTAIAGRVGGAVARIRDPEDAGSRRHGGGLHGKAELVGPGGGDQDPVYGPGRGGGGLRGAFPERGACHGETGAPRHRGGPRLRGDAEWAALYRDAVRRRHRRGADDRGGRAIAHRSRDGDHGACLRCPWLRPRAGDHSPRHQAGEHHGRLRRSREGGGLRAGQGPQRRGRIDRPDAERGGDGDDALHGAGDDSVGAGTWTSGSMCMRWE